MSNIRTVRATELVDKLNRGEKPAIVDVRSHAEIESEKLARAHPLPLHELSPQSFTEALEQLKANCDDDSHVYLMCQSGKRAEMAANKLRGQCDATLLIVEGGMNAVKDAGGPVKKGSRNVMSIERQVRIAAGFLVLVGVILSATAAPGFIWLSAAVGAGLVFAGITDTCAMGMLLARMPWNKAATRCEQTA